MKDNLDRFKALDDAYNERDWVTYNSLLDDSFCGWMLGDAKLHGKAEHVRRAKEFCTISADNYVHNTPYIVRFGDGERTCTVARLTGSMTGPFKTTEGKILQPTNRRFETRFATIACWSDDKIVSEYEFLDVLAIVRQITNEEAS